MYNEERKQWFLNECGYEEPTVELLKKIFKSTELEERTFGKDLCEFNEDEAIDLLKSYNSKSRRRLKSTAKFLSVYYQWCYQKNIIKNILNPFDERTINFVIDNIIPVEVFSDKFFTKKDIIGYIGSLLDDINKFILLAPFYGLKGEGYIEIINLKMKDLDEERKTVKLATGRIAKVDDLFIEYMKKAEKVENYITENEPNNRNYKAYIYNSNGYIIKSCGGGSDLEPVKASFINQRLIRIKAQIGNKFISISNLYKNGLINYVKEQYSLKGISLKEALFSELNGKLYVHDEETQKYIEEFGSRMTVRMLRLELKEYIDIYN